LYQLLLLTLVVGISCLFSLNSISSHDEDLIIHFHICFA
jgi:hypothetical protein